MMKKIQIINLISLANTISLALLSCSVPSQNTFYETSAEKLSFGIKSVNNIENTDPGITYTGKWKTISNASASAGSYSVASSKIDDSDPSISYSNNWGSNNTSNSAPSYAFGKSFSFSNGKPFILSENNPGDPKLTYTGTGWDHNGVSGANNFSFNYISTSNTYIPYNSPSFTYNGTWSTIVSGTNSNDGTFAGNAELTFTGTNVYLMGYLGPDRGIVNLTLLDNNSNIVKTINNIDLYAASQTPTTLVSINGLVLGTYKLRMESANTKNVSSTGYRYDVIRGLSFPSVEYKFTGSHIRYNACKYSRGGKVYVILDGDASKKTLVDLYTDSVSHPSGQIYQMKEYTGIGTGEHRLTVEGTVFSSAPGGYNVFTLDNFSAYPSISGDFYGTSVDFRILKHPAYGKMNLFIDGTFNQIVDLFAPSSSFTNLTVSGLSDTNHYFALQGRGDKNSSSSANNLNFDGIISTQPVSAKYTFNGTGINYFATKGSGFGMVEVFIDNVSQGVFDLYNSVDLYQQTIFTKTGLSNGIHTIEVRSKNTKNTASAGFAINVDGFRLTTATNIISEGFESGLGSWTVNSIYGNPTVEWRTISNTSSVGNSSAYFGNATGTSYDLPINTLLAQNFDGTTDLASLGWTADALNSGVGWRITNTYSNSASNSLFYGEADGYGFQTGSIANSGAVTSPTFDLTGCTDADISFMTAWATETQASASFDKKFVDISYDGGTSWSPLFPLFNGLPDEPWGIRTVNLPVGSLNTKIRFSFSTGDAMYNDRRGWNIDDIILTKRTQLHGELISPTYDLTGLKGAVLSFDDSFATEASAAKDLKKVWVSNDDGQNWTDETAAMSVGGGGTQGWRKHSINLDSSYDGKKVKVKFEFDSLDAFDNNHRGWNIDDFNISASSQ